MKFLNKALFISVLQCFSVAGIQAFDLTVSAKGAVLMNAETGEILFTKNPHLPLSPASTTKMATALYAIEKKGGNLEEMIVASREALAIVPMAIRRNPQEKHPPYRLEYGGTHMNLKVGEVLPFRSLLEGLMLASGNEAANVIAEYVSGNVTTFMQELNLFIRQLGCKNTTFYTPHGLPHEEHKTTAYDMALIAQAYLKYPVLREIGQLPRAVRPETNKQPQGTLVQHNALVKPGGRFYYPKSIGIKTGYTIAAGWCIVAAAEDENRKLIAALFGCDSVEQRYRDAIALFEAAFNEPKVSRTLFSKGFDLFTSQIEGGQSSLQAYLPSDVVVEYYPSEEPTFKAEVVWDPVQLPVAEGQRVAHLHILSKQGKKWLAVPLHALKEVKPTWSYRLTQAGALIKKQVVCQSHWWMGLLGLGVLVMTFYGFSRPKSARRS